MKWLVLMLTVASLLAVGRWWKWLSGKPTVDRYPVTEAWMSDHYRRQWPVQR